MDGRELLRLGAELDAMIAAEACVPEGEDIPEDVDVLSVVARIHKVRPQTLVGLAVTAKAVEYATTNQLVGCEEMVVNLIRDLRRLGILPPDRLHRLMIAA